MMKVLANGSGRNPHRWPAVPFHRDRRDQAILRLSLRRRKPASSPQFTDSDRFFSQELFSSSAPPLGYHVHQTSRKLASPPFLALPISMSTVVATLSASEIREEIQAI